MQTTLPETDDAYNTIHKTPLRNTVDTSSLPIFTRLSCFIQHNLYAMRSAISTVFVLLR